MPASFVVFLVALPLSLGIAIAAGAPVIAGLVAAAVGGIVAGAMGGSVVQVSGPAAGLTVIVAEINAQYGWAATCLMAAAAGLIQIALGAIKVARAALAVSPAIVHGMLAGVGLVIALAQLHVVLGGKAQSEALANILELPRQIMSQHSHASIIGLVVIALMVLWPRIPGPTRKIPAALVAVLAATILATVTRWDVQKIDLPDQPLTSMVFPALPANPDWNGIIISVLTIALVASVESLLSAVAVDKMHDGKRAKLDRELIGQGAGNVISGALGGYPITGVIVRSSTNVKAGGKTRVSAVLHGVWIVAFVAALGSMLEYIPLAALAGLLVFIGVQLVNVNHIKHLYGHRELPIYVVTALGVVFLNLIEGVLLGIALAVLISLRRLSRTTVTVERRGERWHVLVSGSLTFLSVPRVNKALTEVPIGTAVDLDLNVDFMDHAAFDSIHSWRLDHERLGGQVDIDEIHERWYHPATSGEVSVRKKEPSLSSRWFAPWKVWQNDHRRGDLVGGSSMVLSKQHLSAPGLAPLLTGARDFQRRGAALMLPYMQELADTQSPTQLFLTCADSRIVPNLITASGPGDLFTVRNVGNIVPHFDPDAGSDNSVGASLEFAVDVLRVAAVTVCGHSNCGAMRALATQPGTQAAPAKGKDAKTSAGAGVSALQGWLRHAHATRARWLAKSPADAGQVEAGDVDALRRLAQTHVIQQLAHLRTYPVVTRAIEEGRLRLIGLYFDIASAGLSMYDASTETFHPVEKTMLGQDGAEVDLRVLEGVTDPR